MRCSREEMLTVFGRMGVESKDDIAGVVARCVPELGQQLPPRRRIWDSEHYSMSIFEAAALALTLLFTEPGPNAGVECRLEVALRKPPAFHAASIQAQLESRRTHENEETCACQGVRPEGVVGGPTLRMIRSVSSTLFVVQ